MSRPSESARRHFRRQAESVERAGDAVGSNDMALANRLYAAAEALREFADRYAEEDLPIPTHFRVGDPVSVRFDNGVVTGISDDAVQVGSARFYGRGWFEPGQVSHRG